MPLAHPDNPVPAGAADLTVNPLFTREPLAVPRDRPPDLDPELAWDFRLPRASSINTSGHKYGLVHPGVGWVVWRDVPALPEELIYRVKSWATRWRPSR